MDELEIKELSNALDFKGERYTPACWTGRMDTIVKAYN